MATEKKVEVFTYRVTPSGDGRFYVWRKYDAGGAEVEVGTNLHMSEPDAEKEVRSLISGSDVLATTRLHSVDAEDNKHVVLETSAPEDVTSFGAAMKYSEKPAATADTDVYASTTEPTVAQKAVEADAVSPSDAEVSRTDAEQKLVDKADEKAEKEAAKEEDAK